MRDTNYRGLLLIGDPHLDGRAPGFRKDDYATAILNKLTWCLDYAESQHLLPAILGDLFDKPRDNPNWILVRLMEMLRGEVLALYGNHDVHYNPELTDHDSLCVLVRAGKLRLVTADDPWTGRMNGRPVVVGGSSYRQELPKCYDAAGLPIDCNDPAADAKPLVVWLTHHDILIPGYDEVKGIKPREIPGIDLVINGHIHRRLDDVPVGGTRWMTPGNISRKTRSEATRLHVPSALRLDVAAADCVATYVEVPHRPFDEVFHECVAETAVEERPSAFVAGLAELEARRTSSGAGLIEFLHQNTEQFGDAVAKEIMNLAHEVMSDAS